jgi:hypothetical protein
MPNYDAGKTVDEGILEQALEILNSTIPEQTEDAMEDYINVIRILKKSNDFRLQHGINVLKRLYIYPNRKEHNNLLSDLHEFKEEMMEERLEKILDDKSLSGTEKKGTSLVWLFLIIAGLLYFLK